MTIDSKIIHKLGLKYNLTDEEIAELIKLSYKFIRNTIESGDRESINFKNIGVPGLGTFYVSDKYKQFRKYKKDGR